MRISAFMAALTLVACGAKPTDEGHGDMPGMPGMSSDGPARPDGAGTVIVTPGAIAALGIRTVPAGQGSASVRGRAPAQVSYDPLRTNRVTAQLGGQVRWLGLPRPGERVRSGEIVARLYQPEIVGAFEELFVARGLGEPWSSAAGSRLMNLGVAPAEVDAAIRAGRVPRTYEVRAQADGVVVERTVTEGSWVGPGGVLAVTLDPDAVVADIVVVEPIPAVGQRVMLRDPATGETWPARVLLRLPTATAAGVRLRLQPETPTPIGRPLVAEWDQPATSGVWVPRTAVVDTGERQVVFVAVGDGGFDPRAVRLGARAGDEIQILAGVVVGEPVVVAGTFLLDSETQIGNLAHAHGGGE